ncbi:MAG: transketolase C-terminal domain-containing protein, partial [Candidatus Limisoma sp.]
GAFDLSYLRTVPNMIVASPMNEHYLRNLMYTAQLRTKHPFAIRYPRGNGVLTDWHNEFESLEIGKGRKLSSGTGIAIVSIGPIGNTVAKAVAKASEKGISVAHYDMIFLKPIDESILEEVCKNYSQIITVEDGTIVGGLGSTVVEWINDHGYKTRVKRLGIPDRFISQGTVKQLHSICGIGYDEILQSILDLSKERQ